MAEIREVADGLWLWRRRHPDWDEQTGWPPEVSSFCVTSRGVTVLLDALDPEDDAVWIRLDDLRPHAVVYLKPDHFRDSARIAGRYGATLYGETTSSTSSSRTGSRSTRAKSSSQRSSATPGARNAKGRLAPALRNDHVGRVTSSRPCRACPRERPPSPAPPRPRPPW